jgi:hypothetical protein
VVSKLTEILQSAAIAMCDIEVVAWWILKLVFPISAESRRYKQRDPIPNVSRVLGLLGHSEQQV